MFGLDPQGYFTRNGQRIFPVGANYWPGSAGVEMWQAWPADEIQRDLDLMARHGLNTVRFFLRWPDFEPRPGDYDSRMFNRLRQLLSWCRDRQIMAHPSLFVGFMSGAFYWPAWKENRNLWSDPFMRRRCTAFAKCAVEAIKPFSESVLALDHGNEMCVIPDCATASPRDVISWCHDVNHAIRHRWPGVLIVNGSDQSQVNRDSGWRFGQQPGTDFYSMHGYPVPAWHSVPFDGMTDPLCQSLLPLYCKLARAHGPVMLQEFGTILTGGPKLQECYLRAVLEGCWNAGANGFLWWCLKDIPAPVHPYTYHGFESALGLVDAAGRIKDGLQVFLEFARSLPARPVREAPTGDVALWLPRHYYNRDEKAANNDPASLSRRLILANHLLQHAGHTVRIVRGDEPLDPAVKTLIIPSALLAADEAESLEPWVRAGGHLIWHAPDPFNVGPAYERLLGAKAVDFRATRPCTVDAFNASWHFSSYPRNMRLHMEPLTAEVLAQDPATNLPVILRNRLGKGTGVAAMPLVEDAILPVADVPAQRNTWSAWYQGMLAAVQSGPTA